MFDDQTLDDTLTEWKKFHIDKGHPDAPKTMDKFERAIRDFLEFNPKMAKSNLKPAVDYDVKETAIEPGSVTPSDQEPKSQDAHDSITDEMSIENLVTKGWDGLK